MMSTGRCMLRSRFGLLPTLRRLGAAVQRSTAYRTNCAATSGNYERRDDRSESNARRIGDLSLDLGIEAAERLHPGTRYAPS
jgi:hypothetical protein